MESKKRLSCGFSVCSSIAPFKAKKTTSLEDGAALLEGAQPVMSRQGRLCLAYNTSFVARPLQAHTSPSLATIPSWCLVYPLISPCLCYTR